MSRRNLEDERASAVVVGWDNPMRTYFAQIYWKDQKVDGRDTPHEQVGQEYGEVPTVEALFEWLEGHEIAVPGEMAELLRSDCVGSEFRTMHQRRVERILTGKEPPEEMISL
jgi:hypothetical protein